MLTGFLDPYREGISPIHTLDARIKLVLAIAGIVAINLTPVQAWPAHMAYLGIIIVIVLLARVRLEAVLGRSTLALTFVLMAAIGAPFVHEGTPLATLSVLRWRLAITDVGALRFANVMVKAWLSALLAITLVTTTHFLELARAMRSLGIPLVLTSVILLMYRYLYVLVDEAQRLIRAREARTASAEDGREGGSIFWRAQVTGRMIGTLFLRTYERSERIYQAMLARGFNGEIRVLRPARVGRHDLACGSLGLAMFLVIVIVANL